MVHGDIGAKIRRVREKAGISQGELARRIGYSSPASISHFETGERRLTVEDLIKIAGALGVDPAGLMRESSEDTSPLPYALRASGVTPNTRTAVYSFLKFAERNGKPTETPAGKQRRPAYWAEWMLKRTGVDSAPVDPSEVAEKIGVPVFEWQFGDEISGIFVHHKEKTAIGVNANHPRVRQRFTIAHELGHFVYGLDSGDVVVDFYERTRGFSFESQADPQIETKCNQFAADLLMPARWVRRDFEEENGDLEELSARYQVSSQAMWFRLLNLKLVWEE